MNNKVLIKLIVPELDDTFDIFIPVNEVVWKIKKLIVKVVSDLSGEALDFNKDYALINKLTSQSYDNNAIIINTDIRNASELILLSIKEGQQSTTINNLENVSNKNM